MKDATVTVRRAGWEDLEDGKFFTATVIFSEPPDWPVGIVWDSEPMRLSCASPNNQLAEPVAERADGYAIVERDDDMFITQPHWQWGNVCIARRPKLMSNDEWRPIAQRIVAALASPAAISGEGSGAVAWRVLIRRRNGMKHYVYTEQLPYAPLVDDDVEHIYTEPEPLFTCHALNGSSHP